MGTNYIAPTWRMPRNANQSKQSNYSIDFNGNSQYVQSTSPIISGNIDRTVSLWYKMNGSLTTRDTLMTLGVDSDATPTKQRFGISIQGSQRIRAFIYVGDPDFNNTYNWGSIDLLDGNWHHVVLSYSNNNYKLYVDNTHIGTITPSPSHTLNTSDGITIGGNWLGGSVHEPINASIDEVSIFDYTLSPSQVTYLHNLNNPMAISGAEPVAYYPLGDNSNPIASAGYPNISVGADSVFDFIPNDYVDCGGADDFSFTNGSGTDLPFSLSAWINMDDA